MNQKEQMTIKSFRLPQEVIKRITEAAERSGGTLGVSDIVRLALTAGLPMVEEKVLPAIEKAQKIAA